MPRKSRGRGRFSSPTVPVNNNTSGSSKRANNSSSAGSNGKSTPVVPKQGGRKTKNSTNRRSNPGRRTPVPKPKRGGGRKKDSSHLQDRASYKSEDGVVYRPGDYAYVDSQQAELPYHICVIKDFKARKDAVIAEVKWFYRVTELPEAVYLLLMEDRKSGDKAKFFNHPKVKDRELFMAFNKDTHPASLFRGKCYIKKLDELGDKSTEFLDKEDSFFYAYGYKPESRRLTLEDEESFVPMSQQAVLPDCICAEPVQSTLDSPISSTGAGREGNFPIKEKMVWDPCLRDEELLMYLRAARSIALHAGVCMTGMLADGYLAASSDETTQHAFDVLHRNSNNTESALQELIKHPIVSRLVGKKNWTKEDALLFSKGMKQFGKNFYKIKTELLPGKQITELVEYYYYWKKTDAGLNSRSTRRQRKTTHIRLSRALLKPRELTPDKEFVDWSSCDEDDGEPGEDGERKSFYACHHCYSVEGLSWHHAGPDKSILCDECRVHFKNYGFMRPLTVKREPPEFLFKDYHQTQPQHDREESSSPPATSSPQGTPNNKRKTRNSNGTRGAARPGLRSSAKTYAEKNESDEDEEAEASESSEGSEYETPISKTKPLQARRSILDNLDESHKDDIEAAPPAKRPKREQLAEGSISEEESSVDSANADSTRKSPNRDHSPDHASTSSVPDEERASPCSSSQASPDQAPLPQHFCRVTKDRESNCARTDLVYLSEKKSQTSAFSAPGTSAHGGHPSELPTPTANVKVPIITPHAPQLPMGPPAFVGFPQPFPAQGGPPPEAVKRSNSIESSSNREREHQHQQQLLQQHHQQQQQQWMALLQQHQAQGTPAPQLHPSHPHFTPGAAGFPVATPTTQVHHHEQSQPTQPVVFTFPSTEEIIMRQRLAPSTQEQHHHLAALVQHGMYPTTALFSGVVDASRIHEEQQQHGVPTPQPQLVFPAGITMEQYAALQQQQQHAAMAAGMSPVDNRHLVEFQRYFESMMQQVQKEPNLMQHPHVQQMIMIMQHVQTLQAQGHDQHQLNVFVQQNMHRLQQEQFAMAQMQQEAAQKQQKFILARPPAVSDTAPPSRSRPGVIVGTK